MAVGADQEAERLRAIGTGEGALAIVVEGHDGLLGYAFLSGNNGDPQG